MKECKQTKECMQNKWPCHGAGLTGSTLCKSWSRLDACRSVRVLMAVSEQQSVDN